MKKKLIFSAIPAVMLAFGLIMIGCSGGGGGEGTGIIPAQTQTQTPSAGDPATYSASNIELKVAKTSAGLNKAAITPASGNWYLLKYDDTEVSRGIIAISASGEWTFYARTGTVQTGFKAKIENGGLKFTTDVKQTAGGQVIIPSNTSLAAGLQWPAAMVGKWEKNGNTEELTFETGTSGQFKRFTWNLTLTLLTADDFTLKSLTGNSYTVTFTTTTPNEDCTFTAEAGVDGYNNDILTISNSTSLNLIENGVYYPTP